MATVSKKFKEMFANAETLAELKQAYIEGINHYEEPKMRAQLDKLYGKYFDEVKTWNKTKDGELYEKATDEEAGFFTKAIGILKGIEGIKMEMCGTWLWIMDKAGFEGTTKESRATLKEAGCRYAPNKQMWYIAPKNARRSRKHYSYEEIKQMHGVEEVEA